MTCIIGKGSKYFLAEWSEEYEELVVGKEISLSGKEKREHKSMKYDYPHVIVSADNEKEANSLASIVTSVNMCR